MVIPVRSLGQSGLRLDLNGTILYTDPYLTEHVAETEGEELRRMKPSPLPPPEVRDANLVLISHFHIDHCDPTTLVPLHRASPQAFFVGPNEVCGILKEAGVAADRLIIAREEWLSLAPGIRVHTVPAAHTEVEYDSEGFLRFAGYVIECSGRRLYFAGDTNPDDRMIAALHKVGGIDTAFLPVNERNYYRQLRGIIGNMTVREAFQLATDLGVKTLVPVHWDLFAPNCVYREEIELLYRLIRPPFELKIYPESV